MVADPNILTPISALVDSQRRTGQRSVATEATVIHGNRNLEATEIDLGAGVICVGTARCENHSNLL